ncbi:MAP kinase kinase kinase SSK2 [Candida viswanathii]|uniref:MAP kinase kinase kinase n=1 Tax=Candida viswanathii TaxID=5486 RepID=A0A367XPH4_9ASCO|nr:MAP kinase kinase kinase SSK2 [Candida viswanathii]
MSGSIITPDGSTESINPLAEEAAAAANTTGTTQQQVTNDNSPKGTPAAHPHRVSFSDKPPVSAPPSSRKPSLLRKASQNSLLPHDLDNKQRPILSNSNNGSNHSIHKIDTTNARPNHIAIYQNNNADDLSALDKATLSPSGTNGKHFNLAYPNSRSRDKSPAGSISEPRSNRSRSSSSKLHSSASGATSSHSNSQYIAQEKAYLRKMRNQLVNDYYSKGISGADEIPADNEDEEEDDDYLSTDGGDNANLLAAIDDDKYQIDYSIALSLMKNSNVNLRKIANLNSEETDDPAVIERLEWQSMLTSVLTGDVVKSEKTKIININNPDSTQDSYLHATFKENLWFGVRAKMFNRTEDEQRKVVGYRRTLVEQLIDDIMQFEVVYENAKENPIREQVETILNRYDQACSLWKTTEDMYNDKPACRSEEFQNRIDALTAWLTITDAIARETKSLQLWIGNDELDITKSPVETPSSDPSLTSSSSVNSDMTNSKIVKKIFDDDNKSLAERLMKEKDVQTIFRKRVFKPLSPWMIKSKETYIRLGNMFETMKLPDYLHDLLQICIIPVKLIKEIIIVRLGYAVKLQNPTLMMIDQMLDDFKSYITIALEVKSGLLEYKRPDRASKWLLSDLFDGELQDFDNVVLRCVRYFLVLLNRKLLDSSRSPTTFRTFKEPEELEEAWAFLKPLGHYIDGGSVVVAEEITLLALRLIHRLLAYFNHQIREPLYTGLAQDLIRWYSSTSENFGQLRRKLARFTGEISRNFRNSITYEIPTQSDGTKTLLDILRATSHFLVYTGTVETQGTYFFASPELMGNEQEILRILTGSYVGLDPSTDKLHFTDLLTLIRSNSEDHDGNELQPEPYDDPETAYSYVLALCPMKPIVWEGQVVNVSIDAVPITDMKNGQLLVVSKVPFFNLHIIGERFLDTITDVSGGNAGLKIIETRCSLAKVQQELKKMNRVFFKMCLSVLDGVQIVKSKIHELDPQGEYQALINTYFIYARDYSKNFIRILDPQRKPTVIMKMIQLSIDWVSFICDDCIPTDRKTFRWCVLALEFAMDMIRGINVFLLSEQQFRILKMKVARCMSLLISHFDIMGARSSEAEKNKLLKWTSQRHNISTSQNDDEYLNKAYHEEVMGQIEEIENYRNELLEELQSIGRVLDVSDLEYHFVTLLASSFSSVSIRWQKGQCIGRGTFGSVYSAVNLDTGGVMAVKEIRFHDSQSIKTMVSLIKEEMTVLEMLNHPNIVQYFGVEVHRDKVYIFMEFCEGGSLAGLLTHGRIEDEMVIQVYTLQMLEGLAYLHQSGVAHRDIKPENILLDHNGVIKFVDFGAAKVIANSGRTRSGTTNLSLRRSIQSNNGNANNGDGQQQQDNLNSMTGTPMYMSPEAITGASTDKSGVVDIWSLGCCVLEMATGRRPWANLDNEWAIMYHIAAGHKPQLPSPDQLSQEGRNFLARCLEHDPSKRPSAVELLSDPWMVDIRQQAFGTSDLVTTPSSEISGPIPE